MFIESRGGGSEPGKKKKASLEAGSRVIPMREGKTAEWQGAEDEPYHFASSLEEYKMMLRNSPYGLLHKAGGMNDLRAFAEGRNSIGDQDDLGFEGWTQGDFVRFVAELEKEIDRLGLPHTIDDSEHDQKNLKKIRTSSSVGRRDVPQLTESKFPPRDRERALAWFITRLESGEIDPKGTINLREEDQDWIFSRLHERFPELRRKPKTFMQNLKDLF